MVFLFFLPRASHLFSHALLGSSLRPIFPAWQRTQLIHRGFTRLLFLFFRGCVFGKGRRRFVFFVRVSGLSKGQFFPHVVQFISQGFDQGFFFTRWNGRIGQQLMLLDSQVGAPFQQGVLQQLSLVKLHQLIKLLFRDHQDFVHGVAWGERRTCLALYVRLLLSTTNSITCLRTVEDIGKACSTLSKTHDRVETATLDGVA